MSHHDDDGPLVVTVQLAMPWQCHFQALKNRYFPPERNIVPAHITMFHALPCDAAAEAAQAIDAAIRPFATVQIAVVSLYSLGAGVAFRVESDALRAIRGSVAGIFAGRLTRQDAQRYNPHVTVQNKVTPDVAKQTLDALSQDFSPFIVAAADIRLWRYKTGRWQLLTTHVLQSNDPAISAPID